MTNKERNRVFLKYVEIMGKINSDLFMFCHINGWPDEEIHGIYSRWTNDSFEWLKAYGDSNGFNKEIDNEEIDHV